MSPAGRTVLFLASAGDARGRAAADAFRAAAKRMGLPWTGEVRDPDEVGPEELAAAKRVIAFGPHPSAEVWVGSDIEGQVMGLIATFLGGKAVGPTTTPPVSPPPTKKALTAKVGRETAGRRGKGVTIIFDISPPVQDLAALAAELKNACGTGGTVKDGKIEIQGDQRDRLTVELEKRGFKVKRAGG